MVFMVEGVVDETFMMDFVFSLMKILYSLPV